MDETAPAPKLDDPTERAEGFANALVLTVKDQQRRLAVAEDEKSRLRQRIAVLEMVIFEELDTCAYDANQMIVDGIREKMTPAP